MCNFFSCIVTREGGVLFTEEDSHETVIARSDFKDDHKQFVRIEYNTDGYTIDERSIPEWYERMAATAERNVKNTFKLVKQFHADYDKIRGPALADYDKITDAAWADYDKIRGPARADYDKIRGPARADYDKITDAALADYDKITDAALADYISSLTSVEGYVSHEIEEKR